MVRRTALVAEGVRKLMGGISDTLIPAVVALVVGGPVAYYVSLAQSRTRRAEERRAEVIAELFRHSFLVENAFYQWQELHVEGATSREVIAQRYAKQGEAAINSLNDLQISG